jgi:hypothetical protein
MPAADKLTLGQVSGVAGSRLQRPLSGVTVLDMASGGPGPRASRILADDGARVRCHSARHGELCGCAQIRSSIWNEMVPLWSTALQRDAAPRPVLHPDQALGVGAISPSRRDDLKTYDSALLLEHEIGFLAISVTNRPRVVSANCENDVDGPVPPGPQP